MAAAWLDCFVANRERAANVNSERRLLNRGGHRRCMQRQEATGTRGRHCGRG
jgi:hypothetical protein